MIEPLPVLHLREHGGAPSVRSRRPQGAPGRRAALWSAGLLLCTACSGRTEPQGPGGRLEVQVSPLTFEAVTGACYNLSVVNGASPAAVVFDVDRVCSGQFGDGRGAISYVGPCDAQAPNDQNVVEIELVDLYTGDPAVALASGEYRNPCQVGRGQCKLSVACEENADAEAVFNLTIMRDAKQGFFDIAVNFDDIFCSAKVDCLTQPLVLDPITGERGPSIVMTGACTAGNGQNTVLHRSDVVISCDDDANVRPDASDTTPPVVIAVLDPSAGPGNYYTASTASPASPSPHPFIFQVQSFRGDEVFGNNPDLNKCYWNMALGVVPGLAPVGGVPSDRPFCALHARMTATDGMSLLATAGQTSPTSNYPYIEYWVNLTNGSGALACGENPLDVTGSGVTSQYTGFGDPATFCHYMDCEGGPIGVQCTTTTTTCPTLAGDVRVARSGGNITVRSPSGSASSTFVLPATASSATVVDCCADGCCQVNP